MQADVVPQERERNDQRHDAGPVLFNRVEELALRIGVEELLQVPHHVREDVGVPPRRRQNRQGRHERLLIGVAQLARGEVLSARDEPSHLVVARRRMREQRHLVRGVEPA